MDARWQSMMNVGIVFPKLYSHANAGTGPIVENLTKLLCDPFFTAMEVSYIKEDDVRQKASDCLRYSGVDVIFNGGSAFRELKINLSSLDPDELSVSRANGRLLVDQAYQLGARILHIVTGKDPGKEKRSQALETFVNSAKQLCDYAQQKGGIDPLTISLETGDRYFDRQYLLGPTNEAVEVMREVRRDYANFGLLLDQGHFPVMQECPHKALWMSRDYLTHVHIGNSYIKDRSAAHFGDKHLPFGVPDSEIGVKELADFLRTLVETGFFKRPKPTRRPVVSFEVGSYQGESEEMVLANVKRVFVEAWELV